MGKITMFIGTIWVVGTVVLTFMSFSRYLFDDREVGGGNAGLLFGRFFIAMFWWLMLPSSGGRRAMAHIMKGYPE